MSGKSEIEEVDPDAYYDFMSERFENDLVSSYAFITHPPGYFILTILYSGLIVVLDLFAVISGTYTIIVVKDRPFVIQTFFEVGLLLCSFGVRVANYMTRDKLLLASDLVRKGVFRYNDSLGEEYEELKKKRTKRLRFIVTLVCRGVIFSAASSLITPCIPLVFGGIPTGEENGVNPYLPLHIITPFSTTTHYGYTLAFISHSIVLLSMYAAFMSHEKLLLSSILEVTTQLEILRYSLDNIEKRALLQLEKWKLTNMYDNKFLNNHPKLQESFYWCLKENAHHYNAILRLYSLTNSYVSRGVASSVVFFSVLLGAALIIFIEEKNPEMAILTDIFGFLPMCWVGQLLVNESSRIMDALYNTPWPDRNSNFKALLMVFMCATRKHIVVQPKGFNINIDLETHADMVSLGYKYVSVMR